MGTHPPLPPDLQRTLERLFELFSQYAASVSQHEKRRLHTQIVALFNNLGVASESPLVRRAAEIFESIRETPDAREPSMPDALLKETRTFLTRSIKTHELETGVTLTSGARQLLRIPVVEVAELTRRFDREQIEASLNTVFETLSEVPGSDLEGFNDNRTSLSVIRAFWRNFCNIPPFCRGRDQ